MGQEVSVKISRNMRITKIISENSKCLRRKVGCIIVSSEGRIIGSGYNGPPSGYPHCKECPRINVPSGESLDQCPAVHAEINALLSCKDNLDNARTMFVTHLPCHSCIKTICNTHIRKIYFAHSYPTTEVMKNLLRFYQIDLIRLIKVAEDLWIQKGLEEDEAS